MHKSAVGLVLVLTGCSTPETMAPPAAPVFTLAADHLWQGGILSLVSPELADTAITPIFTVDDTLTLDIRTMLRRGDTTDIDAGRTIPGLHHLVVGIGARHTEPVPFTVHGLAGATVQIGEDLPSRPLAVADGSAKAWVGTARGLAQLDARYPGLGAQLIDSTVDPTCLYAIGPSVAAGAVVVAGRAGAGCGPLRARTYGAAVLEVDSGPPSARWRYALHGGPGVWLVASYDTVALAVRDPAGAWTWSRWPRNGQSSNADGRFELSPRGDRAAIIVFSQQGYTSQDALVFDLTLPGLAYTLPSVGTLTFSPDGDTLAYVDQSDSLILVNAMTGARLGQYQLHLSPYFGLRYDPHGRWLYATALHGGPVLQVVDRKTWRRVGQVETDWGGVPWMEAVLVTGDATHVWMLWGNKFSPPILAQPRAHIEAFSAPDR